MPDPGIRRGLRTTRCARLYHRTEKELEAETDPTEREALFEKLLARMYEDGKATEAAAHLEIDAVTDPADTRSVLVSALRRSCSVKN